jgi:acetolactate synthase I/II/III large subunit
MNVAEYVLKYLAGKGVNDVFLVSGGGIMYLTDAAGTTEGIRYWCNYHEQACAIAAEGYARVLGTPGVCIVTTGPGSTNALSAIAGAWVDSIPVIVIAGQVRTDLVADYSKWRQFGPQEIDAISMARSVTKLAIEVTNPADVPDVMEAAWHAATTGRPGPVWVNLPLDIQGATIEVSPRTLTAASVSMTAGPTPQVVEAVASVLSELRLAKRPVIVAGNGVHLARADEAFVQLADRLMVPVVATIGAMDLLGEDHPYYAGRFGPTGQRRANFTVQNADFVLSIGSGLSVAAIGFDGAAFAPRARKVMVNADPEEGRRPHIQLDHVFGLDAAAFIEALVGSLSAGERAGSPDWDRTWRGWRTRFPIVTPEYTSDPDHVNSYYLAHALSNVVAPDAVVLTGNSLDAHSVFHSFAPTKGQRVLTNVNYGAMGWDLPALVGAAAARPSERVVLVTGDGSLLFNVQELVTIGANRLNVAIFVLNNQGYQSIRTTQTRYFDGRLVGADAASGVANPDFASLAAACGLAYARLGTNADVDVHIGDIVGTSGPILCEVNVGYEQERIPRVMSRRLADGTMVSGSLEDQYPFLPHEEMLALMVGD